MSLNALAMKCIEMTLSKEAADWWKQFSFKHWPVNKATISKWHTSFKKTGKIYTLGSHLTGKKLEGPKLHERGIFKSLQLEFEEQVRTVFRKVNVMLESGRSKSPKVTHLFKKFKSGRALY